MTQSNKKPPPFREEASTTRKGGLTAPDNSATHHRLEIQEETPDAKKEDDGLKPQLQKKGLEEAHELSSSSFFHFQILSFEESQLSISKLAILTLPIYK